MRYQIYNRKSGTSWYLLKDRRIALKTKVYHPNIDDEGQMVVDVLHGYWLAGFTIHRLLLGFVSILYDPLLDYPINNDIAEQYENEYKLYEKEAREWTRRYSSTPIASHWLPKAMRTPPAVPHIPATAERREEKKAGRCI
uniref:UBC core domain-containing protein n=1 Tax=Oryza glumipatula TaxID=40148 RepID=A0A0D9YXI7_9ORYZ